MRAIISVDGMMCGMCEAHVSDSLRKAFPEAKKVSASRKKKQAVMEMEREPSPEEVKRALEPTGYDFMGMTIEAGAPKKRFFGLF